MMVDTERLLLVPSFAFVIAALFSSAAAISLKLWSISPGNKDVIWSCDNDHVQVAAFGVAWGIIGQTLAFLNLLFAVPIARPKQAALAHFRTAAISMYPLGQLIWSTTFLFTYGQDTCDISFGPGFACLFVAMLSQMCAISVNLITAVRIRRNLKPIFDEEYTPCTCMVPY